MTKHIKLIFLSITGDITIVSELYYYCDNNNSLTSFLNADQILLF